MTDINAEIDKAIDVLKEELRAAGKADDDHNCLRYAVLKLIGEQTTGFHHNGQPHTTRP